MKRILGAALLLAATVIPAAAADVKGPTYKAPPPVFDWTGFYGGVDVGYIWSRAEGTIPGVAVLSRPDPDGFVGGLHLGYRWQLPSKLVLGIEVDFWGSNADGEAALAPLGNTTPLDINWGGSVRGVVGIAMSPTLLYATGGIAFIDVNGCTTIGFGTPCAANTQFGSTLTGWTAGVGLARAFSPRWIARVEYLYADYGDKTYTTPGVGAGQTALDLQTHTIRGGISYRFTTR
jgi:outer membrane immunogenic protein